MKHIFKAVLALLCSVLLGTSFVPGQVSPTATTFEAIESVPEVLRLHVLANSDDPTDQSVKLRVRDAVLPIFASAQSYEDARAFLLAHGKEIYDTAMDVLAQCGAEYGIQLTLGTEFFPDRTYGDTFYPAGNYDALCIRLGAAEGQNWWCVLFPPLCIVTENGEPVDLSSVEVESVLWEQLQLWWEAWYDAAA